MSDLCSNKSIVTISLGACQKPQVGTDRSLKPKHMFVHIRVLWVSSRVRMYAAELSTTYEDQKEMCAAEPLPNQALDQGLLVFLKIQSCSSNSHQKIGFQSKTAPTSDSTTF